MRGDPEIQRLRGGNSEIKRLGEDSDIETQIETQKYTQRIKI